MRKRRAVFNMLNSFLIVFILCLSGVSMAADQPESGSSEAVSVETGAPNNTEAAAPVNASPSPAAAEAKEMRFLIERQQKQIEKLQSTIERQQSDLDKAMNAISARPGTVRTSAGSSSSPDVTSANAVAQDTLQASNASASGSQPAASQQTAADASKTAAPKSDLPEILKNFKPMGTFYISYQAGSKYSGSPNTTTNYNSFQLKRGYFGAEVKITSYLTSRFVSDITMDSTGDVKLRAKYMYAKFNWKGNTAITNPYIEFGLAHMPWLDFEEAINGFRMQDTMFLERNGIFNSADIGVMAGSDLGGSLSSDYKKKVNSHYAGKYGSWQIGVYNGGGYHAAEQNTNKVFEGRLSLRPVPGGAPGLQFTVFGVVGKGNKAVSNGIQPPDWRSFNGMVSYESEYFTFTGQGYFGSGNQSGSAALSNGNAIDQKGFSVFAAVHIPTPHFGEKVTILGRADEFNSNTSVYNDLQRRYIVGVAFHLYKSNILLFDYERLNHSISTIPGENRAQITLQMAL